MTLDSNTLNIILASILALNAWIVRELYALKEGQAVIREKLKKMSHDDDETKRIYRRG